MNFLKPLLTLTVALVVIAIIGGGHYLWTQKKDSVFLEMDTVRSITLLQDDGKFFSSNAFPAGRKILFIFTPDIISPSEVKAFANLANATPILEKKNIELILVSRVHKDIVKNFKYAAPFSGKLLLDASGTLGRLYGAWPGMNPVLQWHYVITDRSLRPESKFSSPNALGFSDLKKYLP